MSQPGVYHSTVNVREQSSSVVIDPVTIIMNDTNKQLSSCIEQIAFLWCR